MIFTHIITKLLGDRVQFAVLKFLSLQPQGVTGRDVAAIAGCSVFKAHHVLVFLVEQGLLIKTSIGRANCYRINEKHILFQEVLRPLFEFEKNLFSRIGSKIMNFFDPPPLSVILYGSMARGEEEAQSDVDLLLICKRKKDDVSHLERREELLGWGMDKFCNAFSLFEMDLDEFQQKMKERDPFVRTILREGKVLAGKTITELMDL